jgi:hypothetical protein
MSGKFYSAGNRLSKGLKQKIKMNIRPNLYQRETGKVKDGSRKLKYIRPYYYYYYYYYYVTLQRHTNFIYFGHVQALIKFHVFFYYIN